MDVATVREWVALLARLDPDTVCSSRWQAGTFENATPEFNRLLRIAGSSSFDVVSISIGGGPAAIRVKRTVFLAWAKSKGLEVPTELSEPTTVVAEERRVEGIKGLRDLVAELGGPQLGGDRSVRRFALRSGIARPGENSQKVKLSWALSEIEPKVRALIAKGKKP